MDPEGFLDDKVQQQQQQQQRRKKVEEQTTSSAPSSRAIIYKKTEGPSKRRDDFCALEWARQIGEEQGTDRVYTENEQHHCATSEGETLSGESLPSQPQPQQPQQPASGSNLEDYYNQQQQQLNDFSLVLTSSGGDQPRPQPQPLPQPLPLSLPLPQTQTQPKQSHRHSYTNNNNIINLSNSAAAAVTASVPVSASSSSSSTSSSSSASSSSSSASSSSSSSSANQLRAEGLAVTTLVADKREFPLDQTREFQDKNEGNEKLASPAGGCCSSAPRVNKASDVCGHKQEASGNSVLPSLGSRSEPKLETKRNRELEDCIRENNRSQARISGAVSGVVSKLCQRPAAVKRRRRHRTQSQLIQQPLAARIDSEVNQEKSLRYSRFASTSDATAAAAADTTTESSVPFDEDEDGELPLQQSARHQSINKPQRHQHSDANECIDRNTNIKASASSAQQQLPEPEPELEQHVIIDSNSTLWSRLSNLTRSITQRNNANNDQLTASIILNQLASRPAQLKQVSAADSVGFKQQQQHPTTTSSQLAPEVVDYLAKLNDLKQKAIIEKNDTSKLYQSESIASRERRSSQLEANKMTVAAQAEMPPDAPASVQTTSGRQRASGTGSGISKHCSQQQALNSRGCQITAREAEIIQNNEIDRPQQQQQQQQQQPPSSDQHQNTPNEHHLNDHQNAHHHQHHHHHHNNHNQQQQLRKQQHQNQVKLSITTTNTTTTTTNTTSQSTQSIESAASSLSSCILSDSTSVSEVRLKWDKKMDFLLSIIGFAVDLANIWRFPYLVYKNGGGVFLIPYMTMLIFGGIPLFFLELCLGQFVKKGPITVWNKICPYMKGVGYCSILISWYVSFYYNVLIAWSVYFIYRSLTSFGGKMPWEDCDNSWNSQAGTCVSISNLKAMCSVRNESLRVCRETLFSGNVTSSPASEFFVKELTQLDQSKGLDDMGILRPELVVCTAIVYFLHYLSLFKGPETSGKVVWVTATAPYMILFILLVRGLFLPGASLGVEYYLSPRLEKLADPQVWIDAAGQVFYTIGVGFGVHLTYASFNSHNNNCYRDCLMTSAVSALTSFYSGLVVFVYLGYMATNLGIDIDKVASESYSLVFEVYPEALTTLPFARFWSILFFIMLLTLGIDSAMGGLESVITGLEDEFRFARRMTRGQLTALVIVSSFLPALISCTQGGAYTLFWFDIYSAGVSLLFSALFETIGVVYCYGLDKFIVDIESMLGKRPGLFYILCWRYISPTFLLGIIFMSIYTATVPEYRKYTFPFWSVILGWILAFSSVAAIPIVALLTWCYRGSLNGQALNSPSKSPKKLRHIGGADSVSSGVGLRKSPAQQHHRQQDQQQQLAQYKSTTHEGVGSTEAASITTTAIITSSSQRENYPHRHYTTTTTTTGPAVCDGIRVGRSGEKIREHML